MGEIAGVNPTNEEEKADMEESPPCKILFPLTLKAIFFNYFFHSDCPYAAYQGDLNFKEFLEILRFGKNDFFWLKANKY